MEFREKDLYSLIISRIDGKRIGEKVYRKEIEKLVKKGIGGFLLFGGKKAEIKEFISHLQSLSGDGLFIGADIERGLKAVIEDGGYFPAQMAVAAATKEERDVELLKKALKNLAHEAIDCGINLALIPVLDINRNPDNPIIGTRAFSDDPQKVSWLGSIYIEVLQNEGLFCCAKHFPGHGDTSFDSHKVLPVIKKGLDELEVELLPFREAIKKKVSFIMVGHLLYPLISKKPASLSKEIVGILRDRLGFEGPVMTDALTMGALKGRKDVIFHALDASIDILLLPFSPEKAFHKIKKYIEEGRLKTQEILKKLERLRDIKEKRRSIKVSPFDEKAAERIIEKSLTLLKGSFSPLELSSFSFYFSGIERLYKESLLNRYFGEKDPKKGNLIVAIFTENSSKSEACDLGQREIEKIKKFLRKSSYSVVVSFGNPYVLRYFQEADLLIAAYDSDEKVQTAFLKALKGELPFRGTVPVLVG